MSRTLKASTSCFVQRPGLNDIRGALWLVYAAQGLVILLTLAAPVWAQNAPPQVTSEATVSVAEGSTTVATLSATDPEDDSLTWSIPVGETGGVDAAQFTLSAAGVLAFKTAPDYESPADADEDNDYAVTVQVSDGLTPVTADVVVTVENVLELASAITGPATVDYAENGAFRVATYRASSEADQAGLTWALSGDDADHFSIDTPGGALRFDLGPVTPSSSRRRRTMRTRSTPTRTTPMR